MYKMQPSGKTKRDVRKSGFTERQSRTQFDNKIKICIVLLPF